jgi:hypothetical protein
MSPIIPISQHFDQPTLSKFSDADSIVQRYRSLCALFDWSGIDAPARRGPGKPAHPQSAYLKAALVRIHAHLGSTPRWRAYLLDHPLLVLELGFRPPLEVTEPSGFDLQQTLPSVRWLNEWLRTVDRRLLATLFEPSVHAVRAEIPGLGEGVAYDVKHSYASAQREHPRVSMKDRFCKDRQPKGDRDCKVGVKKRPHIEQPDGSKKVSKAYLWGYGSGVAAARVPDYGTAVMAEDTHPFNDNDVEHFPRSACKPSVSWGPFPCTSAPMRPLMPGMSIQAVPAVGAWLPSPRTSMLIPSLDVTLMGCHAAQQACACSRPLRSARPTAPAPNAPAAPCSLPPAPARRVSTSNLSRAKAVSRTAIAKPGDSCA